MMHIVLAHLLLDKVWDKRAILLLAKCIEQGVFTIIDLHMSDESFLPYLIKVFAHTTDISSISYKTFAKHKIGIRWIAYYFCRIKDEPKMGKDPWEMLLREAIMAKNEKLVWGIATRRRDRILNHPYKGSIYLNAHNQGINLASMIEPLSSTGINYS